MSLRWGVIPLLRDLTDNPEQNVRTTCEYASSVFLWF